MSNIIISLTTIPPRFNEINLTINSLLNQKIKPNKIIINIPEKYNNYTYSDNDLPQYTNEVVIINKCQKDYGPATKLLGLSMFDLDDNDLIIVCDDDREYSDDLVENLTNEYNKCPDGVYTGIGWTSDGLSMNKYIRNSIPPCIDILAGCCGFLIPRRLCPFNDPDFFITDPADAKYYVDDVWISGFLTKNKINIYLMPCYKDASRTKNDSISSLTDNKSFPRNNSNILCFDFFAEKYQLYTLNNV